METIRLRTLTRKSILLFGKYEGRSIQQLIDLRQANYLRWVYLYFEGISFIPEILKEIHLKPIEKPGCDRDLAKKINDIEMKCAMAIGNKINPIEAQIKASKIKNYKHREHKRNYMSFKKRDSLAFKKSRMQGKNQGH